MTREDFMTCLETISGGGEPEKVFGAMNEIKSFYDEYETKTAPENVVVEGKPPSSGKTKRLRRRRQCLNKMTRGRKSSTTRSFRAQLK